MNPRPFNMMRFGVALGVGLATGVATFAVVRSYTGATRTEQVLSGVSAALGSYGVARFIQSRIPQP